MKIEDAIKGIGIIALIICSCCIGLGIEHKSIEIIIGCIAADIYAVALIGFGYIVEAARIYIEKNKPQSTAHPSAEKKEKKYNQPTPNPAARDDHDGK